MANIDYSATVNVEIVPHFNEIVVQTPLGPMPGEEHYDQFQVFVNSVDTPDKKFLVGYIGKQDGANFCPIGTLDRFPRSLQLYIGNAAKKLHKKASPLPWTDVPPPLSDEQ